jgi:hypothetical protein
VLADGSHAPSVESCAESSGPKEERERLDVLKWHHPLAPSGSHRFSDGAFSTCSPVLSLPLLSDPGQILGDPNVARTADGFDADDQGPDPNSTSPRTPQP